MAEATDPEGVDVGKYSRNQREVDALLAWINTFLDPADLHASEVSTDFSDGVLLISFLKEAFDDPVCKTFNLRPKQKFHKLDNMEIVFSFLEKQSFPLLSIDRNDIVNCQEKQTVNLLWNLLRFLTLRGFQLEGKLDSKASGESTSSIRTMLIKWLNELLAGEMVINDLGSSFQDGTALARIVNKLAPGHIDLSTVTPENAITSVNNAFKVAEEELGIPSLMNAEDLISSAFKHEKTLENYLCILVSTHKALMKRDRTAEEMDQKMENMSKKKEQELASMAKQIEEEKQQFAKLQEDMTKLQGSYTQILADASAKSAEAEIERKAALDQLESLSMAFEASRQKLEDKYKIEVGKSSILRIFLLSSLHLRLLRITSE
jgi:hypothetical protein